MTLPPLLEEPYYLAVASMFFLGVAALLRKKRSKCASSTIPLVPYILPWFGSAFNVARMGLKEWLIQNLHRGPIFKAHIYGRSYVFVTDPVAARQILNSKETDVSSILQEAFGKKSVSVPSREAALYLTDVGPIHNMIEKHFSTDRLNEILIQSQQQIKTMIPSDGKTHECGLFDFIAKIVYRVTLSQLFAIPELETDQHFNGMRLYLYHIRRFCFMQFDFLKYIYFGAFRAREAFVSQIKQHLIKNDSHVSVGVTNNTKGNLGFDADAFLKKKGVSVDGRARLLLVNIWVSLVNTFPTVFSLVYRLLENPLAKEAVLEEVRNIAQRRGTNADFTQEDLNKMVILDAVLTETLRFDTTRDVFRYRQSERDLNLRLALADGKKVEVFVGKGSRIITCPLITNRDEDVFENANKFVWDRFVPRHDGHAVEFFKSGKLLPYPVDAFASGPFYCPGRNFARVLTKALVANLLLECDIKYAPCASQNSRAFHEAETISWHKPLAPDVDIDIELRPFK